MDPYRAGTPSNLPPGAAAPHLMGVRAESGSIFREAVWPPPGQPSALVDPLVKASSAVDLSRIVDDVVTTIKGSIELWPTLVEICYFEKDRRGLPRTRVANRRPG